MILPDDSRGVLVSDLVGDEDGPYVPAEMLTSDIPLPDDYVYPAPAISLEDAAQHHPNFASAAMRNFAESVRAVEEHMREQRRVATLLEGTRAEPRRRTYNGIFRVNPDDEDPDHDVIGDIVDAAERYREEERRQYMASHECGEDCADLERTDVAARTELRDDLGILRDLRRWNEDPNVQRIASLLGRPSCEPRWRLG